MLTKTPVTHSSKINSKNSFTKERLKTRSKLDKRIYKINISKENSPYIKNDFKTIDSYSQRKRKIINSHNISNDIKNKIKNDKMSYIPDFERRKAESNFIKLINALINTRKKDNNITKYKKYFEDNKKQIPYKPKGYKHYEYIREHPVIINDDDNNIYSKVINDLKRDIEIDDPYNNEMNKSYKSLNINKLTKGRSILNSPSLEDKNKSKKKLAPIIKNNYENLHTINTDKKNNDIFKSDRINHISIDCDDVAKSNKLLSNVDNNIYDKINIQKDYKQSDIFNLINDNLSKNKSSEKYLFNKNYYPQTIEKTSINDIGWSPKGQNYKSRINCSSVPFNILSPNLRSITQIKKDIDVLNHNNFDKIHLMSEFIDMCKPGEINLREEFNDKLNENKNIFHKKNYCAAYSDLHHEYKDLVNEEF